MNRESWLLLRSGAGHYAFNMALDEALLEAMPRLQTPVLRLYGWAEPAASFGYFQRYAEVERLTGLRPLVRRPTAGGIVPHDCDWTYSLALPTNHEWYSVAAIESYRRIHEWICNAFNLLGIATELAPSSHPAGPGQCFVGYERFDLLYRGRKIAGAAQRRRRDGLLIQGSVQSPEASLPRADWEKAMCLVGEKRMGIVWREFDVPDWLEVRAEELARAKYSQEKFNRKK